VKRLLWLCLWFGLNGGLLAQEQRADSIVAIVNDEIITYDEVMGKIKESIIGIQKSNLSPHQKEAQKNEIFKMAVRHLVDEKLTLQEAKRYNIKISEETIRQQLEKELTERGNKLTGITEMDLTELIRNRLTLQELFQKKTGYSQEEKRRAAIDTFVSPSEMHEFYQKNIQQFSKPSKIKTRIITLFYFRHGGREQALANAKAIVQQLRESADFAEMARLHSHDPYAKEGGTWPRIPKGDKMVWGFFGKGEALYEEVEDIAFSMKRGEISEPIPMDSRQYCQIVKIEDMQEGGTVPFEEVQEAIQQRLRYEKVVAALAVIRERLRERSFIWPPNLFKD
jgi:parvulin-like peptidyl-prolyl isomerase